MKFNTLFQVWYGQREHMGEKKQWLFLKIDLLAISSMTILISREHGIIILATQEFTISSIISHLLR